MRHGCLFKCQYDTNRTLINKDHKVHICFTGCFVTAGVLTAGLFSMIKGTTSRSQKLMRARITSQGLTLVAILAGVFYHSVKNNP